MRLLPKDMMHCHATCCLQIAREHTTRATFVMCWITRGIWQSFTPCTDLSVSGARHFAEKRLNGRQYAAVSFFMSLTKTKIPKVAIENPICIMSTLWRRPDQIIQPWMFGHGETKATCLWLSGLPPLKPTCVVPGREARIHKMPPAADRGKLRSETYLGIAEAMAAQWGELLCK